MEFAAYVDILLTTHRMGPYISADTELEARNWFVQTFLPEAIAVVFHPADRPGVLVSTDVPATAQLWRIQGAVIAASLDEANQKLDKWRQVNNETSSP